MVDRWGAFLSERQQIQNFWEWLLEKYGSNGARVSLYDIHMERELDEYHEIDQRQLDNERRQLIEHMRRSPIVPVIVSK